MAEEFFIRKKRKNTDGQVDITKSIYDLILIRICGISEAFFRAFQTFRQSECTRFPALMGTKRVETLKRERGFKKVG